MAMTNICILGGSGFVGTHLVRALAAQECQVKVLTRRRERSKALLVLPGVSIEEANIFEPTELQQHFSGMHAVINLVGILHESRRQTFRDVHVELPQKIAAAATKSHVPRLLHMSALGASTDAPSAYLRSKAEGEAAVLAAQAANLNVTVFRPSVIFGPGDNFINLFARLVKWFPVIPLGSPDAKFQPVYVSDVVAAFVKSLSDRNVFGKSLELCGPKVYTLKELLEFVASSLGLQRRIIPLSPKLSYAQAVVFEFLPGKLLSRDNLLSMQVANTCSATPPFNLEPTALEAVAPFYLTTARLQTDVFRGGAGR